MNENAVAVVNGDDPLVVEQARRFPGQRIRYGFTQDSDVVAADVARNEGGLSFTARYEDQQAEVRAPLHGKHNVYNLLAALAIATTFGLPLDVAAEKLSELGPVPHRGERLEFSEGFMVIDETYNSNPAAMASVLDSLAEEPAPRRVAVLGDMLELGELAESAHLETGRKAAESGLAFLLGVGPLGDLIVEGARRAGMEERRLAWVERVEEAGDWIAEHVRAGDVVLLKASRGVGLDRALDVLKAQFTVEAD
jgi:UDP-N-acetylmuramoyl-tripeptide--D-alanyl-D-alanine ligase